MTDGISTAYRFTSEGLGIQAVTDPAMEQALSDGRIRVRGLLVEGLVIEEECDIARGEIESGGMTISIVDRPHDHVWTKHLAHRPAVRTWLLDNIAAAGDATFDVDATVGISEEDVIHIGTEALLVDAVNTVTEIDIANGGRGYWDTIPQAHYVTDGEDLARPVVTLTRPLSLEGRRCFLHRYVLGVNALDGDGTLIWRGILSEDAKLSAEGTTWSLGADPISALLKQDLGGDIEQPFSARGVFYPESLPFDVDVIELAGTDWYDRDSPAHSAQITMYGHFESQRAFVDELTSQLASVTSAWSPSYLAGSLKGFEDTESGRWGIQFRPGSTAKWVILRFRGETSIDGLVEPLAPGYDRTTLTSDVDMIQICNPLGAGSTYGHGMCPRGYHGNGGGAAVLSADPADSALSFYPDGLVALNAGDTVSVQWPEEERSWDYSVGAEDDVGRFYALRTSSPPRPYYVGRMPECTARRRYATGNLNDFRDAIVAAAPAGVNRGASPLLTDDELADWSAVVERAAVQPWQQRRTYEATEAVELDEVIAHECRLLGVFPRTDSDGKIGLGYLELPSATSLVARVIGASEILVDEDRPTWARNAFGTINVVEFKTEYDAAEDEHTGTEYRVRDVTALSSRKKTRPVEIAPKSRSPGGPPEYREVTQAVARMFGVFGRPYSVVTLPVAHTVMADVRNGDIVSITSPYTPDTTQGARGVESVSGLVTARSWDLATERGRLTIIVSEQQLAGYTPSLRIKSTPSVVSGDEYDLPVDFGLPGATSNSMAPSSATTGDFFTVGDEVEVLIWDATTQTPQSGIVTAVTDGVLRVDFDAAPTFTGTRYVRFAPAASVLAESQTKYAYLGGTDSKVSFSSGDESAKEFSA